MFIEKNGIYQAQCLLTYPQYVVGMAYGLENFSHQILGT